MNHYNLMKAWKENDRIAFDFHNAHDLNNLMGWSNEETIKGKLRLRLQNTKVLVVLIGEFTKNLHKFVRWEIDYALENKIPVVCVNLNGTNGQDSNRCPAILRNETVVHIPWGMNQINHALNNWPSGYASLMAQNDFGWRYYPQFD